MDYNGDAVSDQEWFAAEEELNERESNRNELRVKRNVAEILSDIEKICMEADKKYAECWEYQPTDESEDNICVQCGGMLYIEQGGIPDYDCPSCNATGYNLRERIFNQPKFGEWVEENPFFYDIIQCLQELRESNISA